MGGNNHFPSSRNNVMITESVGGMNFNKLTWKGSDNQSQRVQFVVFPEEIYSF